MQLRAWSNPPWSREEESNAENQPTGHGPMGWLEKGPSASLFVRYVSHRICSSLTPRIQTLLKPTVGLLLMIRCTNLIFVDWTAQRSTRVVLQRARFDQATQRKA